MKLRSYIFFRKYINDTIVCDVKHRRVHIMNSSAFDILTVLSQGIESIEALASVLSLRYATPTEEIIALCNSFVEKLHQLGFFEEEHDQGPSRINTSCCDNGDEIEQAFIRQLGTNYVLYSAFIELTYNCNLACTHCYVVNSQIPSSRSELTTQQVIDLLDDLSQNNVFRIIFSGGEVFTRPDFIEILEYAISKRFLVDIFSNGVKVTGDTAKKIAGLNVRSFQTSLYGCNSRTHDSITRCPGSFDATLNALKLFSALGVATNIKSSFMKDNVYEYEGIKSLAEKIGATFQPSFSIMPAIDGNKTALSLRISDSAVISEMVQSQEPHTKPLSSHICSAGLSGISINPYGDIFACNTLRLKIGSIFETSIGEIWTKSKELQKIRSLKTADRTQCVGCPHLNVCNFCPGIALSETGDICSPYAEACTIAQAYSDIAKGRRR